MPPGPNQQPPLPGSTPQPGQTPQVPNAAIAAIDQLLRSPRPGGLQGLQNAQAGGLAGGSGIAGVASQADADSIMVYNDHTNYKEWEFIFDFSKWKPPQDPRGSGGGTPVKDMGTQPTAQPTITPQGPGPAGPGPGR